MGGWTWFILAAKLWGRVLWTLVRDPISAVQPDALRGVGLGHYRAWVFLVPALIRCYFLLLPFILPFSLLQ